jgi:hypothetical protein
VTTFQIVSLCVLGAVVLWQFVVPHLKGISLPKGDPILRCLDAVIRIRESSSSPEVKAACNSLLQALLK